MNTKALKALLLKEIKPEQYYKNELGVDLRGLNEAVVWCPFHNDKQSRHKSLAVSSEGKFYCHSGSCGVYGTNIIQFHERAHKLGYQEALIDLYSQYVAKTISDSIAEGFHANLTHTRKMLGWLKKHRGLTERTIDKFKLGFDNKRITIPIYNEFGLLVNIRYYDWTRRHAIKMLSHGTGYGGRRLYPVNSLKHKRLVLCEGEFDALITIQNGIPAVTPTCGVGSWDSEWNELFRNRQVSVCFDVNDDHDTGQKCALKRAAVLSQYAEWAKVVKLPLRERGGDLTDFFVKHQQTKADLRQLMKRSPKLSPVEGAGEVVEDSDNAPHEVTLGQASSARFFNKKVRMRCIVAGKDLAPYMPPAKVRCRCRGESEYVDDCEICPLAENDFDHEFQIADDPRGTLHLIDKPTHILRGFVCAKLGLPNRCKVRVETVEAFNVEHVQLIPEIDFSDSRNPYVLRDAYYVGHGLTANRSYEFTGYTIPEPSRQYTTHVLTEAKPAQSTVETFSIDSDVIAELTVFQPNENETIEDKFAEIYHHLAINATRIFERNLLHQAVDLAYHSVLSFRFNGEQVQKGWMDVLILGDTRTGKGYVAEGLIRYYRLGEIVSAENCTFAGLVGGMQQVRNRWLVTWGKMPLNDGRLIVVDEASAMPISDWERLSRVRSEGVAEIVKIQTERTSARTRVVWLANPRSGAPISTYSTGVEAVLELVGKTEDVARFDYAVALGSNEVPSGIINRPFASRIKSPYTSDLCRKLVLWAWSRAESQIRFKHEATKAVLEAARDFGRRYTAAIPLIQVENVRVKIAKLAVAIAARTFSHDGSGEILVVDKQHVQAAVDFLDEIYTQSVMGYDSFSRAVLDRTTLKNSKDVQRIIDNLEESAPDFVEGMLELNQVTLSDVADYAGIDRDRARAVVSALVQQRALMKEYAYYKKKPAFINWLKKTRERYRRNGSPRRDF